MSGQKQRAALTVLMPGLIAFAMGQTALFAIAGPVFRDIGMSEFQLGIIISSAAVVFTISSPIWGRLADSWGRKRTIVFGLTAYGLASFGFAAVMQAGLSGMYATVIIFSLLLILRLLYAALGAGIQPASVALMADLSSARDRSSAMALVGAAFGIGTVLGPAAAAALVGFGVLTPLYAIAVLGLFMAVMAALFLKEPDRQDNATAVAGRLRVIAVLPFVLIGLLTFTAISAIQQTIAFYVQDYLQLETSAAARMTGFCFMALAAATLVAQGGLIQIFKPRPSVLLLGGFPVIIAGLALYAMPASYAYIVAACAIMGLGFGFINPGLTAAASLRASNQDQGAIAGIVQGSMAGGFIVGPAAGTALYQLDPHYTILLSGAALIGAFIVVLVTFVSTGRTKNA